MQPRSVVDLCRCEVQLYTSVAEICERYLKQRLAVHAVCQTHELNCMHVLQLCRYRSLHVSGQLQCVLGCHSCSDLYNRYTIWCGIVSVSHQGRLTIGSLSSANTASTCRDLRNTDISHYPILDKYLSRLRITWNLTALFYISLNPSFAISFMNLYLIRI